MAATTTDEDDWDEVARRLWPLHEWLSRHPRLTDWFVVLACAGSQSFAAALAGNQSSIPILSVGALLLLWRRAHPLTVLIMIVGIYSIMSILMPHGYQSIPFAFALFSLANAQGSRRALLGYVIGVLIPVSIALTLYVNAQVEFSPTILDPIAITALAMGIAVRSQRQRAKLMSILWEERAESAKTAERARIAADMHDVVAHSLSTMIALANGAESAWSKYPERSASALQKLSEVGRAALLDMNRTLQLLPDDRRTGDSRTEPGTTPQSLEDLIEVFRSANLPVRLSRRGGPPPQDPELQMTIFRIVQEGLTNALRYANGAKRVEVEITTGNSQVDITISDDAPTTSAKSIGSGRGLFGIAARAASYEGTSHAGPRVEGGWRTHARLHLQATPEVLSNE